MKMALVSRGMVQILNQAFIEIVCQPIWWKSLKPLSLNASPTVYCPCEGIHNRQHYTRQLPSFRLSKLELCT